MHLPPQLIDLLEDTLVRGLRLRMGDVDRFKKEFRQNPESYLVSLIISSQKDALDKFSATTEFTLWHTVGKNLKEAEKLVEEWEREPALHR